MTTTKITPEMLDELETTMAHDDPIGTGQSIVNTASVRALIEQARLVQELRDAYAPLNSGELIPAPEYNELARQFDEVLDKVLES